MEAVVKTNVTKKENVMKRKLKSLFTLAGSIYAALVCASMTAFAKFGDTTATPSENVNADDAAARVLGLLLDITKWAGVALAVYGVYEVVMSFMQNQPEAKTKGIIMALCGVVMIGMPTLLQQLKILG